MRIAIMGTGATGSFYGAKLARAGYDVTFIARGAHLKVLQAHGLKVTGQEEFSVPQVRAVASPTEAGTMDVILFCVKAYDTDEAARLIVPMIGPDTMVVPIQNGVNSYHEIGDVVGLDHVVGGICRISVEIPVPGTVQLNSPFKEILFGEMDGSASARTAAFAAVLEKAEIPHRVSAHVQVELWKKFIFITAMSALTGATRSPIGPIRECPETFALYGRVAAEVVKLDSSIPDELIAQARAFAAGMKASLLVDLERGRRTEVETLQGTVVVLGKKHGIPTPVTEVLYALIKLHQPK
ncbi:MAG TPA: ketopantoate reductase family protein [Symbiobacteriaceae bacterium]|jgi:2-dehydropantoate 2-reductase